MRKRGNAREGVAALMSEHITCVKEIRRISFRVMYIGFCIERELWNVKSVYALGTERSI